jgi:hypothetical protein
LNWRLFWQAVLLATLIGGPAIAAERYPRVVIITAKGSSSSNAALAKLRRSGGDFALLRAQGWIISSQPDSHVQVVDQSEAAGLVEQLNVKEFPAIACIDHGEVVRSFQSGCTTPLDRWTISWLAKGIDERPATSPSESARVATTNNYPLRGNHWSVDGDWNPTRDTVVHHLRSPNHVAHLLTAWKIDSWSYEELRSLHDNLHEQEMGGASYARSSSASHGANQFSASRKILGH